MRLVLIFKYRSSYVSRQKVQKMSPESVQVWSCRVSSAVFLQVKTLIFGLRVLREAEFM